MENIIYVEFCKVVDVIEHNRKSKSIKTKQTYKPTYTFILELLFADSGIVLNTILRDMDNNNTFRVIGKRNSLYTCRMIKIKRRSGIRKPKKLVIVSIPHSEVTNPVSEKPKHLPEETCRQLNLDIDSMEKQINGQSDMLCLVYDDTNKLYCDLLKSEISENYDIRILVKKKQLCH